MRGYHRHPGEHPNKWIIGIDPGVSTGFAVYSVEDRNFEALITLDFWKVYQQVKNYPVAETLVIIEVPKNNVVWHATPRTGIRPLQRQAVNVGRVLREAELLAEGIELAGYTTIKTEPQGKTTKIHFERLTGWRGRLNQHQRDAGMLCWGGRGAAIYDFK